MATSLSERSPDSQSNLVVLNPATGEIVKTLPVCSRDEVLAAVERARKAQQEWGAKSFGERGRILLSVRDWMLDHREEVLDTIVSETGKPRIEALSTELIYCADLLTYYAGNAARFLRDQKRSPHLLLLKSKRAWISYVPYGVVGIISPWNFPLNMTLGDSAPALMAGNAVVIKPSEITPLTALLVERIYREVGAPEHLLQVMTGFGETGEALADAADMIAFTGSIATGRKIAERAARSLKPVSLELGGKDPMVVFADADLERAANAAVWGAMLNSGQVCQAVERVYVEDSIADRFTEMVVERVRKLRQGREDRLSSSPPATVDIGSMTSPRQIEIIERHLEDARQRGARVLVGGHRRADLPGIFFEPTVVTGADHSMSLMTEETFGPVIPIMRFRTEDEALAFANETRYGLSSSVWTRDRKRARRFARRIQAGNVCINDVIISYAVSDVPFGGVRDSGIGHRHAEKGIQKFCQIHSVVEERIGLKREPIWYPYSETSQRFLTRAMNFTFRRGWRRLTKE